MQVQRAEGRDAEQREELARACKTSSTTGSENLTLKNKELNLTSHTNRNIHKLQPKSPFYLWKPGGAENIHLNSLSHFFPLGQTLGTFMLLVWKMSLTSGLEKRFFFPQRRFSFCTSSLVSVLHSTKTFCTVTRLRPQQGTVGRSHHVQLSDNSLNRARSKNADSFSQSGERRVQEWLQFTHQRSE